LLDLLIARNDGEIAVSARDGAAAWDRSKVAAPTGILDCNRSLASAQGNFLEQLQIFSPIVQLSAHIAGTGAVGVRKAAH
jgi:hypothetical protein